MLLTPHDLAQMLQLEYRYVRERLIKRKGFPKAIRIGSMLRWRQEDIDLWLEKSRV